jgi:hypothetical protein
VCTGWRSHGGVILDRVPPDFWLNIYRAVWSIAAIYVAVLIVRLAWRVQAASVGLSRGFALSYVAAPPLIATAGVIRPMQIPVRPATVALMELPTWLCAISGSMMALAAALSWILRLWPYRRFILAVLRPRALVLPGGDDGTAPMTS